jgi:hypothetical protein
MIKRRRWKAKKRRWKAKKRRWKAKKRRWKARLDLTHQLQRGAIEHVLKETLYCKNILIEFEKVAQIH